MSGSKIIYLFSLPRDVLSRSATNKTFNASKLYDSNCVGVKISTSLIVLTCAVFAHEFSRFANFPSAENVTSFVVTVFG